MTILHINKFYFLHRGAERYYFELTDLLEQHGHHVIPFAMQHPKNRQTPYARFFPSFVDFLHPRIGLQALRDAKRFWWSREAAEKLDQLLTKTKPDLAHLHNIYHQLSPSILLVLKKHRVPIVMTVHDYNLLSPNYNLFDHGHICETFKWSWMSAARHRCVKNSYAASLLAALEVRRNRLKRIYERYVDRLLVPSQFMKDTHARWGFPVRRMEVLPLFVVSNIKYQISNHAGDGSVLFVGALSVEKGLWVLLEAAKKLPGVQFKIAGAGPDEERLKRAAPKNMVFLGRVSPEDVQKTMRAASMVVVPSVWYENFPLVVAEAMVAGRPVVASRIGGIPEMVRDGETGLLVPPQDPDALVSAIKKLLDDDGLRARMGTRGHEIATSEYNPELHYERLMKVYASLVSQ